MKHQDIYYRPDIDGLRAVAAFSVVLFHAFTERFRGGFAGVDIFFVISGFLITGIILRDVNEQKFSFREFYERRIKRIFPSLLTILLFCVVFGWFCLWPDDYEHLGKHIIGSATFSSNFFLWQETGYFDRISETKPLLHLWSLAIEEQFYLVWPLCVVMVSRFRLNLKWTTFILFSLSLVSSLVMIRLDPIQAFFSPVLRFWELLAGALLQFAYSWKIERGSLRKLDHACSFVGLACLGSVFFFFSRDLAFPGWWALIPVAATSLVIFAGPNALFNRYILSHRWIVALGLISYPLYLWHWPLLSFARTINDELPHRTVRAAIILLAIGLSWVTMRYVELPMRFGRKLARIPVSLGIGMVAFLLIGTIITKSHGLKQRELARSVAVHMEQLQWPLKIDENCKKLVGHVAKNISFCRYHDVQSQETVAIIGDSHAYATYSGFTEYLTGKNKNVLLLGNSGCPLLLGAVPPGRGAWERDMCANGTREILDTIRNLPSVQKVFFVSRGMLYMTGREPFAEVADETIRVHADPEKDEQASDSLYFMGLQASISALREKNKDVFVLMENPEWSVDPRHCIKMHELISRKKCEIPLQKVVERQRVYRDRMRLIQNAQILDTLKVLCPQDLCRMVDRRGHLLYIDDDHTSLEGSRVLASGFLPQIFDMRAQHP